MVPYLDLHASYVELEAKIEEEVRHLLKSGHYILDYQTDASKENFPPYLYIQHIIGVASAIDTLEISSREMNAGSGDEVIGLSTTSIATRLAVSYCGLIPVRVELNEETKCIN